MNTSMLLHILKYVDAKDFESFCKSNPKIAILFLSDRRMCEKYANEHLGKDFVRSMSNLNNRELITKFHQIMKRLNNVDCELKMILHGFDRLLENLFHQGHIKFPKHLLMCKALNKQNWECFKVIVHFTEKNEFINNNNGFTELINDIVAVDNLDLYISMVNKFGPLSDLQRDSVYKQAITNLRKHDKIFTFIIHQEIPPSISEISDNLMYVFMQDHVPGFEFVFKQLSTTMTDVSHWINIMFDSAIINKSTQIFTFMIEQNLINHSFITNTGKNLSYLLVQRFPDKIHRLLDSLSSNSRFFKPFLSTFESNLDSAFLYCMQHPLRERNEFIHKVLTSSSDDWSVEISKLIPTLQLLNLSNPEHDPDVIEILINRYKYQPTHQQLGMSFQHPNPKMNTVVFNGGKTINVFFNKDCNVVPLLHNQTPNISMLSDFINGIKINQIFMTNFLKWFGWGTTLVKIAETKPLLINVYQYKSKIDENERFIAFVSIILSLIKLDPFRAHTVISTKIEYPIQECIEVKHVWLMLINEHRPKALNAFCRILNMELKDFVVLDYRKPNLILCLESQVLVWSKNQRTRMSTSSIDQNLKYESFLTKIEENNYKDASIILKDNASLFNYQRLTKIPVKHLREFVNVVFNIV